LTFEPILGRAPPPDEPFARRGRTAEAAAGAIGQAQGSTGFMQLATAVWTTDPTMEQGLEAPAPGTDAGNRDGWEGEQSASRGTARKGEEARTAVKGKASNGRPRDAAPRRRSVSATARSGSVAVGGGKASKGGKGALRSLVSRRGETGRTPGSAAGRNKPARSRRIKPSRWCETTRAARGRDWLSFLEGRRGDA